MNAQYPIFQEPPKSNQEAFDRVWNRFIRDKQPRAVKGPHVTGSPNYDTCAYRTDEGLGCAVGIQLPDELYRSGLEGSSAHSLLYNQDIALHFRMVTEALLSGLQKAHDENTSADITAFAHKLRNVAQTYGLTVPAEAAA